MIQIDDVLQYILSKNTIFIFYLDEIDGGVNVNDTFLSFKRNIKCDLPIILLGPSCSIPIKFHFLGYNSPKHIPFDPILGELYLDPTVL